jgi:polyisoprenoid-binding protein YceI
MKHVLVFLIFSIFNSSTSIAQEVHYKADLGKSTILWFGYYLFSFGEHNGKIDLKQGEITLRGDEIVSGSFEIDMLSIENIDMGEDGKSLSDHLKGEDFFAVDQFPKALFKIDKVEKVKDRGPNDPNMAITGSLTLKGVTHPVTIPAWIETMNNGVTAKAKFKIDRTKWNVRYGSGKLFSDVGDGAISDAIGIELNLHFIK